MAGKAERDHHLLPLDICDEDQAHDNEGAHSTVGAGQPCRYKVAIMFAAALLGVVVVATCARQSKFAGGFMNPGPRAIISRWEVSYQRLPGACADTSGKETDFGEEGPFEVGSCEKKCTDDDYCDGYEEAIFHGGQYKNYCKIFSGGSVVQSDKHFSAYTCFKKVHSECTRGGRGRWWYPTRWCQDPAYWDVMKENEKVKQAQLVAAWVMQSIVKICKKPHGASGTCSTALGHECRRTFSTRYCTVTKQECSRQKRDQWKGVAAAIVKSVPVVPWIAGEAIDALKHGEELLNAQKTLKVITPAIDGAENYFADATLLRLSQKAGAAKAVTGLANNMCSDDVKSELRSHGVPDDMITAGCEWAALDLMKLTAEEYAAKAPPGLKNPLRRKFISAAISVFDKTGVIKAIDAWHSHAQTSKTIGCESLHEMPPNPF